MNLEVLGLSIFVGICIVFGILLYQQFQETKRQNWVVCNSDHVAENLTQYCLSQSAINTTLWSERHK